MNEHTEQLIRELADKLGTTAEHLWGVLVRQALYSEIIEVLIFLVVAVFLVRGFKWLRVNCVQDKDDIPSLYTVYWLCWFVFTASLLIRASLIVSGFFNPEYWALRQILK